MQESSPASWVSVHRVRPGERLRGEYLRRVFVIPEPDDNPAVKVQSVELYEDGVIVRWRSHHDAPRVGEDTEDAFFKKVHAWTSECRLVDDAGTEYEVLGGHGSGTGWWRGEITYIPGVPEEATYLDFIHGPDRRVRIDVAVP